MAKIKIIVDANQQNQFEFANKLLADFDEKILENITTVEIHSFDSLFSVIISCNPDFGKSNTVYVPLKDMINSSYSEEKIFLYYKNEKANTTFNISLSKKEKNNTITLIYV